jgi:cobalt-zinc-cadmium efflux system protein
MNSSHHHCSHHNHSHNKSHGHSHIHGHHHHHHGHEQKNILMAFILNFSFAIIEFFGGYITNSVAIYSDALHDLGDSLSLLLSYFAEKMSLKKPDEKFTFGYRRFSILSAFINALILSFGSIFIIKEAVERLLSPEPILAEGAILLAIFGVAINGYAAYKMSKNSGINSRMIMLHLLEDALGWIAILVVSIILLFKPWFFLDAVLSILISLLILLNVWKNLKIILKILMQGFPENIDQAKITTDIKNLENIIDVHLVQGWSIDESNFNLTLHVHVSPQLTMEKVDILRAKIEALLKNNHVHFSTIQFEGTPCTK